MYFFKQFYVIIDINIFFYSLIWEFVLMLLPIYLDYPDFGLSGLPFVPVSPDKRGSTVYIYFFNQILKYQNT